MGATRKLFLLAGLLGLVASGCDRRQPWEITNGAGLEPSQPPQIVAEVYEGGACGLCEPEGSRVYCSSLTRTSGGPAPRGLVDGAEYCFMATALDEDGQAFAIGCVDARAGATPIRIELAPIQPGRFVVPSCQDGPMIFVDAGTPMDAGAPLDAGPPPDAGPAPLDAGPPPDAGPPGLPVGTIVRVLFTHEGSGTAVLFDHDTGSRIGDIPQSPSAGQLTTRVGESVRVEATPAPDFRILEISGGGCAPMSPCVIRIARSETIRVVFSL